jgi:hypothetical protein
MGPAVSRAVVDGKFFRIGPDKQFVKGDTYGPFRPNATGDHFCTPERTEEDFTLMET